MSNPVRMTNLVTGEVMEFVNLNQATARTPFKRPALVAALSGVAPLPGYRIEKVLKPKRMKRPAAVNRARVNIAIAPDLYDLVCNQSLRDGITAPKAFRILLETAIKKHFIEDGVFLDTITIPHKDDDKTQAD